MTSGSSAAAVPEWATTSGDVWARRWRDTDAALEGLSAPLLSAIGAVAPAGRCKAFEVGCGPGTTTIAVADRWPDMAITACDISAALAGIAEQRAAGTANVRVVTGDAERLAAIEGPFDLFFSRHGVMFFADPIRAFKSLRGAATPGASLIFSCFRSWDLNPWACEVANAAAGRVLPSPGREPGGFAFAEPDYVLDILTSSGWTEAEAVPIPFRYVAGEGDDAVGNAFSFLADLGPASRVLQSLAEEERAAALERMRSVVERHFDGTAVTFDAAAWIWRATAS
jgi:SAM-dependent methyltransferase